MTPSRRRQQRASAAHYQVVVAAFVLLCQAAAWVHAAAIPHVTCLEHGDSVHLAAQGQAGLPQSEGDAPSVAEAPDEATAHAHEHCSLQGHRAATTPRPAHQSQVATVAVAPDSPAAPPPPAVSLLLLAPKTSPPRPPVV